MGAQEEPGALKSTQASARAHARTHARTRKHKRTDAATDTDLDAQNIEAAEVTVCRLNTC